MVTCRKRFTRKGCSKRATFGMEGSDKLEFCAHPRTESHEEYCRPEVR